MGKQFDELYSKAQFAFSNGRYDTAIALCRRAGEAEQIDPKFFTLAGNAYLVQRHFAEAEVEFVKAAALDPENGERYFDLGNCLLGQERLGDALEQYAKAIQLGCRKEILQKIYYLSGTINQVIGKNAEALLNYDKADAVDAANENQVDMLLKRVQIYVEQNNWEKAENCAIQLKLLMPGALKSYQLLYQMYLQQRKIKEAEEVLNEAEADCEKTAENATEIGFDRAMLFCFQAEFFPEQQKKNYEKALEILIKLEGMDGIAQSDKCEAMITRSDINLKLEQFQDAQKLAETVAAQTDPALSEYVDRAYYIITKCYAHRKDYQSVQKYAVKLKESSNLFNRHYGYYAEAYAGKQLSNPNSRSRTQYADLYNRAIAYYKNCTVSNAGDFLAYLYRAKCYVDIGKFEKAAELSKLLPHDAQKNLDDYIDQEKRRCSN